MTRDARWLAGAAWLVLGCTSPDISYGEHAVLRPRNPSVAGSGGQASSDPVAGAAGASGTGVLNENPPEIMRPLDPIDAAVPDAESGDAAIEAGTDDDDDDPFPYCPSVPHGLVETGASGDGATSGCQMLGCPGNASVDSLDISPIGLAFSIYDPSALQGCTAVIGDLVVHNHFGADLSALSCLEVVTGTLLIINAPELETLDGLDHLQHVGQSLLIGSTSTDNDGLGKLTSISSLGKLQAVLGSLAIRAPSLTSLNGLQQLRAVVGDLVLDRATSLQDLSSLFSLEAVGGDVVISGASSLALLGGADRLATIGGSLHLDGASNLRSAEHGFPQVSCIGSSIRVLGPSPALERLELLPSLKRIGGDVSIHDNVSLTSIALDNVERIRGTVVIQGNDALAHVELGSLERLGGVLMVSDNPQLDDCPLLELARALDRGDISQIHDNAPPSEPACAPPIGP